MVNLDSMEQALSLTHYATSSPGKSFSRSRKRSTQNPNLQAFQASISATESPPSSLHPLISSPSHSSLRQIHAHVIKSGEKWSSYSLFYNLIQLVSPPDLLEIFRHLHRFGTVFRVGDIIDILEICGELADVFLGLQIHALIAKTGLDCDSFLRCSMMDFYEDIHSLASCDKLFGEAAIKDVLLWNKELALRVESEEWQRVFDLFREMQFLNLKAEATIIQVLSVCGRVQALDTGKEIHGHAIRTGILSNVVVSNSLITMYAKNSLMEAAKRVFESIENPSLISWNSMVSGYSLNGFLDYALELLDVMVSAGMQPDLVTWNCLISGYSLHGSDEDVFDLFRGIMQAAYLKPNSSSITTVLRTVVRTGKLSFGKEIHGFVTRCGLECSLYVATALLDMYANCYNLNAARRIFNGMKHRNIVTWNSMISGYANEGSFQEALELLKQMEREGIQPNLATWNGLITGYAMKGKSRQALILIRQLKFIDLKADTVSWTALISGCCRNGLFEESLTFFDEMQKDRVKPNSATLATVLRVCAGLALLKKGTELHCYAMRSFEEHVYVSTALIDMYCKSGSLRNAHQVFRKLQYKNLATWNAMILGFANYGKSKEAFFLFDEMLCSGLKPDSITFTALLTGCRHSGLIDAGWKYFDDLKCKYNISPSVEHYACMVDLLARAGYLDEAFKIIQSMPFEPDASIWGALLGACRTHGNTEIAEVAADNLLRLEPYNSANYLLMMSVYASDNRWDDVQNMRVAMNAVGVKSRAGWSWIQIEQTIHVFSVEGEPHPDIGKIYFELYQLVSKMRMLGYVPDTSCIVHNIGENEKKKLLMIHTEKLAITYGLISTSKDMPVRVITNTRVCNDCHMMAKFISEIRGRDIYLRDGVRFHHFKDGQCSCNDYW